MFSAYLLKINFNLSKYKENGDKNSDYSVSLEPLEPEMGPYITKLETYIKLYLLRSKGE
jgi:hypothetical protein